jgi:HEAT repeat protein
VTLLQIILLFAAVVLGIGFLAVLAWLCYAAWLTRVERRLARRKGLYRDTVAGLAQRERVLLEPEIRQLHTLRDFEALEAVLEEQARGLTERPSWLLDTYDRLGLVDKYVQRLRTAKRWRERAFAAELLGRVGNAKAVPVLLETIQATRSEDADVREIALRALARIGDTRAVEPLVLALKESENWLAPRIADILVRHGETVVDAMILFLQDESRHPARAWAANVLGELKAQRAFPVLVASLKDLDDEVRSKSAGALGKLGDSRAVSYLLDHLLSDPAPFVRARIAGALGQFADHEVIERLVRALGDPAWWVRMRSVEALEQIGPAAESPLTVALDDPDPEIRIRAAVALERLGVPARLMGEIEWGQESAESERTLTKFGVAGASELLAEHLNHSSSKVRRAVIGAIRRAERHDLAPELIERVVNDTDPVVRSEALEALRALGAREAVPAALVALGDGDERVRAAATSLLGTLGGSELASVIQPRSTDKDPMVRAAAARALGLVPAATADREFSRLLRDPDSGVRAAAAAGAADAGWKGAAPLLLELLADQHEPVRVAAARGLGQLGDGAVLPSLIQAYRSAAPAFADAITQAVARIDRDALSEVIGILLERDDVTSRASVVRTIGGLGPPYPVKLLGSLFGDRAREVRVAAVEVLSLVPGPATVALLQRALEDADQAVRVAAVNGLVRLGHEAAAPKILSLLREDPSPLVRERAALATGLFRIQGGEVQLLALSHQEQPLAVRAAALLAIGAYDQESLVVRALEMADESELRDLLRERIKHDAQFRLLGLRLHEARQIELRALGSTSREQMEQTLAEGIRGVLSPEQRIRLVAGLRAFQGERSRGALLAVVRGDPSPEVRATALTAVGEMLDEDELHLIASRALVDPHKSVRNAAVALFKRIVPAKGLPDLLHLLRSEEDPAVLQAVAEQAGAAFPAFLDLALAMDRDGREAILLTRLARYMQHPELKRILAVLGRSQAEPVREAVAGLWAARPDLTDKGALEAMTVDASVEVRREVVAAWAAAGRYDRLTAMLGDPDPEVRQAIARAFLEAPNTDALAPLALDPDEKVRATLFVTRLLRGEGSEPPAAPRLTRSSAAAAVLEAMPVDALRDMAKSERDQGRRLSAALALAVLGDEAAYSVMRSDPIWAVRDRVARMLSAWQEPPDARHSA